MPIQHAEKYAERQSIAITHCNSSAKMQPTDHMSTAGPYDVVP
jgi:hypothetical protein